MCFFASLLAEVHKLYLFLDVLLCLIVDIAIYTLLYVLLHLHLHKVYILVYIP